MRYNYFYFGTPVTKMEFINNNPLDWEKQYDEIKGYSNGGYKAIKVEL